MPVKLDETDSRILKALMEDGRMSVRMIARTVSVTTPTVESRLKRLFDMGVIKKISLTLDSDKIEHGVYVLIDLKADPSRIDEIASRLAEMDKVRSVFMVTGKSNMSIRVLADSMKSLQEFLTNNVAVMSGIELVSSNVITRIVKEEQGVILRPNLGLRLRCDYCKAKIQGEPSRLTVGDRERYFCSTTCLEYYREKYGSKIEELSRLDETRKLVIKKYHRLSQ
jgi:Lrp/AsnC family transcriptional regulator for asnA, asnC and gidA